MKKHLPRLFSFALALLLIVAAFPIYALAERPRPYGESCLSSMPNSDALLHTYKTLADGIEEARESIDLSHSQHAITAEELHTVFYFLFYDHPEFFWLSGGYKYSSNENGVLTVGPSYNAFVNDLSTAKSALRSKVDELCRGLQGKSDYEKSLLLHDRLILAVSYNSSPNDQNAYGALVEGRAVCAGYSRAYQLLLQEVGIRAWSITGSSYNPVNQQLQNHEWNLVSLDGEWYYTDVTWDDQGDTEDDIFYSYLNISTKQMEESHVVGDFFVPFIPNTTATAANYFAINGGIQSRWDEAALVEALSENGLTARIYADMPHPDDYLTQFKSNLDSIAEKLHIVGSYSYSFRELDHEFVFTIKSNVSSNATTALKTTTTSKNTTVADKTTVTQATTVVTHPTTTKISTVVDQQTNRLESTGGNATTTDTTGDLSDSDTITTTFSGDEPTATVPLSSESGPTSTATTLTQDSVAPIRTDTPFPVFWIVLGTIAVVGMVVAVLLSTKKR